MAEVKQKHGLSAARLVPLVVILAIAVAGYFTLGEYLSFDSLRDNREDLLAYRDQYYALSVLGFMIIYVTIVAFSLPGAAVASLTGGFLFGVFPGVPLNVISATIGASIIFTAARYGLGETLSRKMDASQGAIKRVKDGLRENELSFLLLMRLVPAVPFFAANLIPALVGVRLGRFVLTTFIGIIPGALIYTWVGAGLGEVFASGQSPDFGMIFRPYILGPILGLCILAALPVILKILRKKAT